MQTVATPRTLRGGLRPLPMAGSRLRIATIAAAKKAATSAPAPAAAPVSAPEDVPPYFLPSTPEAADATTAVPQAYTAVPQYPVAPPPAPAQPAGFWSSVPPLVWVGVGILVANIVSTALNFVKGGPQKMQEMAMQTMMNQMMKQAMKGAPPGAANPFAAGGGFPGGFPGAMGAGAAGNPFAAAGGFPGGFPTPPAAAAAAPAAAQPPIDTTATPAAATTSAAASTTTEEAPKKKKSSFKDVDPSTPAAAAAEASTSSASFSAGAASPPPFTPPPPPPAGAAAGAATAGGDAGGMLDMLRNPEMQKMLYPYLPEPMRNPETFEWMLNSPEYRAQLEGMLTQQMGGGAPPAVQELMKDADMSPEKMKEQFDALGMTPEQFVSKVMSDPDLATSMTKPSVMTAIAECTKNPMAIFKYQNDEEVMRVFEKMTALFPQAAQMGAMPGMGAPGAPNQQ